jgi:hypothetical protein
MGRKAKETESVEASSRSRRALLLGGAAGLAGLAADALISAQPAGAAEGDAILLGADTSGATHRTAFFATTGESATLADSNPGVVLGTDTELSVGVSGKGHSFGVFGWSDGSQSSNSGSAGVLGTDNGTGQATGVTGYLLGFDNDSPAVLGMTNGTGAGVMGFTQSGKPGVLGQCSGSGPGVLGQGVVGGIGVQGDDGGTGRGPGVVGQLTNAENASDAVTATTRGTGNALSASITNTKSSAAAVSATTKGTGHALKVAGRVAFSTSGLATVAARRSSVTVTLADVTTSSMILATLQTAAGAIGVANAVAARGKFVISLTDAPSHAVKVAYFVLG